MRRSIVMVLGTALAALGAVGCNKDKAGAEGAAGAEGGTAAMADNVPAFDGFEGEIDVSVKGDKPTDAATPVAVLVKTGKARIDIPESLAQRAGPMAANMKGYGIFEAAAKKIYVVLDPSKQVVVVDLDKIGEETKGLKPPSHEPHDRGGPAEPEAAPPKVTKTGKYDSVAGYKCENWDISSDHREGTACVAQSGFSWLSIPMSALNGVPTEKMWMAELLDGKHFPLRLVGYAKDGTTESGRMEVTKLEKKPLPDSEFTYPPTYALVDLDQMIRGFAAMRGMGMGMGMSGMAPGRPMMPNGMPMPGMMPAHQPPK